MGTAARKLSYKSHLPRLIASWMNREVAVPLKHGEAGATPVDAPNEDVTQMDRVLVSETSGHRYRFAEASYDPCHPRSWERIGITCSETNKRTVAGLGFNSPRFHQISRSPSGKALVCKTDYSWVRFPPWSPIIAA